MNVKIAKELGYCFGVKRAMKMAWDELENSPKHTTYALGPLIHNKQAVEKYEQKGLKTINEVEEIPANENIVIRSHGVGKEVYDKSNEKHLDIIDTTCPFVKKIHNIVNRCYSENKSIVIIGDKKHPEVIGINGWCNNTAIILKTIDDAKSINFNKSNEYCVVAQTTININLYNEIIAYLKNNINVVELNNTICSATKVRQESARELAKEVDAMVVIGGKHSSNTQKLVQICEEYATTYSIETKEDLDTNSLSSYNNVGVTAGASTPDWIIDEVIELIKLISVTAHKLQFMCFFNAILTTSIFISKKILNSIF